MNNKAFNKKNLEFFDEKIDLLLSSRVFTKSLWLILKKYRDMRMKEQLMYKELVLGMMGKYYEVEKGIKEGVPLKLCKFNSDGEEVEGFLLHKNQIDICLMLEKKNAFLGAVDKRFISSKVY